MVINEQQVALPYQKYGVRVYESGVNQVVEIARLGLNVTYNGMAFTIRMPYSRFGYNTEGQCGKGYLVVCASKMKYQRANHKKTI